MPCRHGARDRGRAGRLAQRVSDEAQELVLFKLRTMAPGQVDGLRSKQGRSGGESGRCVGRWVWRGGGGAGAADLPHERASEGRVGLRVSGEGRGVSD
jgi:hypothetical protein